MAKVLNLHGSEADHENATIDRLKKLGYSYIHGTDIKKDPAAVVLEDRLLDNLRRRYPKVPVAVLDDAVKAIAHPHGVDTLRRNRFFHAEYLLRGFEWNYEEKTPAGSITQTAHIHPIAWDNELENDFLVVNQLPIQNKNDRRPDIIVYVNGLPLVLFELKNPYDDGPTVEHALNQIGHYTIDIPQLFDFNAFCVLSDGSNVLHGMWPAGMEWYAAWNSIDGKTTTPGKNGSMKSLIEGLFPKRRLLDYIRNFIVFEDEKGKLVKKAAKYHQFFAVAKTVERTAQAFATQDKRIGLVWHTTGSGKSLSMTYLVGILRRHPALANPTFVVQVDRNDLDDQLHDQFVRAKDLVGDVQHAGSVDELRKLLQTGGGGIIFTTIEKFALKRGPDGRPVESEHPVLSARKNIIVIADEAHRSQYGFLDGYARYLAEALPNAKRLGFTGTPISFHGADTEAVFGDCIDTYDIQQSQADGATVRIYYAPRQAKLRLSQHDIDAALADAAAERGVEGSDLERKKSQWAQLAALAGANDRVQSVGRDLLTHFTERSQTLMGKAMVVCMTRANCVKLYDALRALPGCPDIKVVMTGNLGEDPTEWSRDGHITTKSQRDAIKARMVDPDDPLKMVIVCDMWLTGTDIPCLHTLYVDKPMRGHSMIQAISRVNRVFRNKPHGLIVDYIGIADELREATKKYAKGGGSGDPAPDVEREGVPLFMACLQAARDALPPGNDYGGWRNLGAVEVEDLHRDTYDWLTEDDDRREAFFQAEARLSAAFLLVGQIDACRSYADEVIFCQRVRSQLQKVLTGKPQRTLDQAIRDLVDGHVESEGVVDVFQLAGIPMPDVSILSEEFLESVRDKPNENLRLKLLQRLLHDEIKVKGKKNAATAKKFSELLAKTMDSYHKRLIDAAAVVRAMLDIKGEIDATGARAAALGMSEEELAFYDAVHENYSDVYDEPLLKDIIHDVVAAIKGKLTVDWTLPHRQAIKAAVKSAVKLVLRKRGVREGDLEALTEKVIIQAAELWRDWPMAA